jgi:thiamine biosynthesis lipoprotein
MLQLKRIHMGTPWEIRAHGTPPDERRAVEAADQEIERVESLLSRFRPGSEISRINRCNGPCRIRINPEVGRVIAEALRYAVLTEGAFDPTAGALSRLWGFGPEGPRTVPPDEERIQATIERLGYRQVCIDEVRFELTLRRPGMEIDLGGMGKGYAVDRAVAVLKENGINRAWVSCGSTAFALGPSKHHDAWRVGIRDPSGSGRIIQTVQIRDRAIATSGAYEQFFNYEGRRYGHICDPRTGYPAAGSAGVTVIAPTATEADALSTAAFVLGARSGRALLDLQEEVEACFFEVRAGSFSIKTTRNWKRVCSGGLNRRRFLVGLMAAAGLLVLKPPAVSGTVYLTDEEALRLMMPEGREFKKETVTLTDPQAAEISQRLEKRIEENVYTFYRGTGSDSAVTIGYAVVLNVIGKERPITFMVGVDPQGRLIGIEVLTYRESRGSEIRSKRFINQFIGKTLDAPLKLGRDIDGISGATLSSRSTAYAVKKALALAHVVYGIHAESSP